MAQPNNNRDINITGGRVISVGVIAMVLLMSTCGGAFHLEKQYQPGTDNVVSYTIGIIDTDERNTFFVDEVERPKRVKETDLINKDTIVY